MQRWRIRFHLQELDLVPGRTILGRDPECPISFDDSLVSRCHAEIHVSDEGCMLIDLGSKNGVWVNGRRIVAPCMLRSNDRIRLGRDELVVLHGVVDELATSERPTGMMHACSLCGHEHVADLAFCPACGLHPDASAAVAEFLDYHSRTAPRTPHAEEPRPDPPRDDPHAAEDQRSGIRPAFRGITTRRIASSDS